MIKTNKIIVVGKKTNANLPSAPTLISQFPDKNITVIESPNIPTVVNAKVH